MWNCAWKPVVSFLLLISLSSYLLPGRSFAAVTGLDAFLAGHSRQDPTASSDSFLSLPSTIRRSISTSPSSAFRLSSLRQGISVSVPVYVRLAGPSFSPASPSILSSFLSAAHSSANFQVIGGDASHHHLAISHSLHLDSARSPQDFAAQISDAVRNRLDSSVHPFIRTALHSVPVSVVDEIVRREFLRESQHKPPGVYIYLLDPGPQSKPYAYSYGSEDSPSPQMAFSSSCLGSLWVGSDRYVWVDLAAGPVDYGPALSGDGVLQRGDFHPLAVFHGRPKSERTLLADLASLVLNAHRSLLVPSLRIPVVLENSLLIRFIHIHGSEKPDLAGLNFDSIEKTIRGSGLLLEGQSLAFESYGVKYTGCAICSFSIARSTHSLTSRFLFDNYTLIVSEYLDSKRLRQILSDSAEEMNRAAGITDERTGMVVPVYVFDLEYDKTLLLDRYHQSVAFKDMVVAVRTWIPQTVSDYSCNGRNVIVKTRELERPILGSLLQSMWGVSPTHLSWSSAHNDTLVDYTWSVGQTPFGPFSSTSSLSFVQKDAARRNTLLTGLNYTVTSATDALSSLAAHGGDMKLLKKDRHVEFVQRWNFFKYKIDKAVSAMSHLDYERASYLLRSSDHDLYAIHTLIYQASNELQATLVCFKDPPFPWVTASLCGVILFAFFFGYTRRDKLFRNKRKKF